jgi:hypothetical protein
MPRRDPFLDLQAATAKHLADKGKLIEAGWLALFETALPVSTPEHVLRMFHFCYMAGAQHLFAMIMSTFDDDGDEPSAEETERMYRIAEELETWRKQQVLGMTPPRGSA